MLVFRKAYLLNLPVRTYDLEDTIKTYHECEWCYQVFNIKKAFKENEFLCNGCYRLLEEHDIREVISPQNFYMLHSKPNV